MNASSDGNQSCILSPQFSSGNEAIPVLIENPEGFPYFFLSVGVLHLPGHHGEELGEVNGPVAIRINFIDHVLELSFGRILPERSRGGKWAVKDTISHCITLQAIPHDGSELLCGDGAVSILVEQRKSFLEFGN